MAEIPSDVHPLILTNLPPKSLLKFLTVSKTWYTLIKSHNFIKSYHKQHKSFVNNHELFLLKDNSRYFAFRYASTSDWRRTQLPNPPDGYFIGAILDGLICLSKGAGNFSYEHLLLWNPYINKFKTLDPPSIALPRYACSVGLGRKDYDYKVVLISFDSFSMGDGEVRRYTTFNGHVYSVNNPSLGWKNVTIPTFKERVSRISRSCFMNDTIHWIIVRADRFLFSVPNEWIEYDATILSFNVNNDCFTETLLPTAMTDPEEPEESEDDKQDQYDKQNLSLAVINDFLAVVQLIKTESSSTTTAVVWRMEEYGVEESWKVLYRINLSSSSVTDSEFLGNVIITTGCGRIIAFDDNQSSSGICNGDIVGNLGIYFKESQQEAFDYTETLVLLDA